MTKEGRFEREECQVVSLFALTSKQVNKRREHSMDENRRRVPRKREAVLTKYWLYIQLSHEDESEGLLLDSSFEMNQTRNEDSSS